MDSFKTIHMTCKNFIFSLFILLLTISCKDEKIVENPVSSDGVSNALNNFPENKLHQSKAVKKFYEARNFVPAWNDEKIRSTFLKELGKAGEEGLFAEDYHVKILKTKKASAKLEILLTDAFLEYAHDLYFGKLDPEKLNAIWGIERKPINLPKILQTAIQERKIKEALAELKPENPIYSGLKKSLSEYREKMKSENEHVNIPTGDKPLKPGKKDPRVPTIAERLKQLEMLDESYVSKDSVYDEALQNAVKNFQKEKGLATDEVLGNSTIQQLNMDATDRYSQILANLERWRWYPRDLGNHYILINIPNYKLNVVKNGEVIRSHNVIAGDPNHHTPIFSDSIQYIVINPEWNIPSSIRDNEIIPNIIDNPGYLQSKNMYAVDSNGNRVDPRTVDWAGGEGQNYRIVQGAGASNSLGRLKIIYPNPYSIYLHDTPAKAIFNQNIRAESHGCVRVENVVELAAYILNDQKEWGLEKIKEAIATGKTQKVEVTRPISVHHFYWTAWREKDKTVFINDIYGLDKAIYSSLSQSPKK